MRFAESIGMALCKTALMAEDAFIKEVNQIFDGLQQMHNDPTVGTSDCWSDFQILPHRLCYFPMSRRSTAMLSIQKTLIELGISVTTGILTMAKTLRRNLMSLYDCTDSHLVAKDRRHLGGRSDLDIDRTRKAIQRCPAVDVAMVVKSVTGDTWHQERFFTESLVGALRAMERQC